MEETLRYFFSAVFQGFAAIIALGSMFYISYLDRNKNKRNEILSRLTMELFGFDTREKLKSEEEFIIDQVNKRILSVLPKEDNKYEFWNSNINNLKDLISSAEEIKKRVPSILKLTWIILLSSIISLFLVGYFSWLNSILFFVGIVIIIISAIYFVKLKGLIYKILEL